MPNIPGIEKVKTMKTTHSRSVPPNMDESYIGIYMLIKEKERLEKESTRLDIRKEVIFGRLQEIEDEIERLQRRDKRVHRKREFDCSKSGKKAKKEADPEEPENANIKAGWKIKTLNKKRQFL